MPVTWLGRESTAFVDLVLAHLLRMHILSHMKTTRTAPRNINIVTLRRGGEWTKLTTSEGQLTAWLENSEGDAFAVALDAARERIATLLAPGSGWSVAA